MPPNLPDYDPPTKEYVIERAEKARNEALKILSIFTTLLTLATGVSLYLSGKKDLSDALKGDPIAELRNRAGVAATQAEAAAKQANDALLRIPLRIQSDSIDLPKEFLIRLEGKEIHNRNDPRFTYTGHVQFKEQFRTPPKLEAHFTHLRQAVWQNEDFEIRIAILKVEETGFDFQVTIPWVKGATIEWIAFGQ